MAARCNRVALHLVGEREDFSERLRLRVGAGQPLTPVDHLLDQHNEALNFDSFRVTRLRPEECPHSPTLGRRRPEPADETEAGVIRTARRVAAGGGQPKAFYSRQ